MVEEINKIHYPHFVSREYANSLKRELDKARAELTKIKSEQQVLLLEREEFIKYLLSLSIDGSRPILVGPIQLAKWVINKLEESRDYWYDQVLDYHE